MTALAFVENACQVFVFAANLLVGLGALAVGFDEGLRDVQVVLQSGVDDDGDCL